MKLTVFRNAYVDDLRNNIADNIDFYKGEKNIEFGTENLLHSNKIEIDSTPPTLSGSIADDLHNAIAVYEYLPIDETQASDVRLWTYLTHITFREYVLSRWAISGDNPTQKIIDRWFLTGNARTLRRNAISRLWWATYLTIAPWEDQYFASLCNNDKYIYTKTLFMTEDLSQGLIERRLGWSKPILIAVLDYFNRNPELAKKRQFSRQLIKEINLLLGYRKIMTLSFDDIVTEIEGIAKDISCNYP